METLALIFVVAVFFLWPVFFGQYVAKRYKRQGWALLLTIPVVGFIVLPLAWFCVKGDAEQIKSSDSS